MKLIRPLAITDAVLASSNVAEAATLWNAGTTYGAAAVVYEVVDNVHQQFTSKAGGNLNHRPSQDTTETYWEIDGPTNRWNMLDGYIQTATANASSIEVELDVPADERVDTIALLNLSGTAVQVTATDATDGVIYDETFSLVSPSGITDLYGYLFEPIVRLRDLVLTDLTTAMYAGLTIEVAITESGETVSCGALLVGLSRNLGGTQWGAQLGLRDYSVKEEDGFGNLTVVQRAYRKTASFSVMLPAGFVDEMINLFADYRATPALWLGSNAYSSTAVWGFYKDFKVQIAYPDRSLCSLELESLT